MDNHKHDVRKLINIYPAAEKLGQMVWQNFTVPRKFNISFFYVTEDNCVMITQMYEYVNVIFDLFDLSKRVLVNCVRKIANTEFNQRIILANFLFSLSNQHASAVCTIFVFQFLFFFFSVLCFHNSVFFYFSCICFVCAARLVKHQLFFILAFSKQLTVLVPNLLATNQDAWFDQNNCKRERF